MLTRHNSNYILDFSVCIMVAYDNEWDKIMKLQNISSSCGKKLFV